ncbi:MAG: ABC transporter ATP-binding protein [Eubacteriales bacterium]|nr:ABC transporter ATP-binding protein [Eubacteriales bacterium]
MIRTLAKSIREYKLPSVMTSVTVGLEVVMEVIIPLLMAQLVDKGIEAGNMGVLAKYGIGLIFAAILSLIFGVVAGRCAAIGSCGFAKNLRHDMYYNVQNYAFSNIDKFSTASIVTRLTTDVNNVQMAYQMITRMAIRSPFMMLFSLFAAFSINAKLSMIFLACVPILAIGLWLIMGSAHPTFERVFKTYDRLNGVVQENLRGMRVVKTFVREDFEKKKFTNVSESIYSDFSKAEKLLALNGPLMQFCMYVSILFISWMGAKAIVLAGGSPDGLTTGELMSLVTYAMQILSSLMMISMVFVMITISRASAKRICEILTEDSDIKSPSCAITEVRDGSVSFENVRFSYGRKRDKYVLDDINLDIKSGETIGIIGGTGSSKSSLVQLIPRLYDVDEGSVKVGGIDVREYDIEALRDSVAVVLQKNVLFSGTIKENLRWGNESATDEEIERVCKLAQADGFISEMPDGYETYIEQGGANVSGGQKQRLCIARALIKKPKILILDDSTSAVDTKTDALIRKAFAEEIPDTTKFIIAQRISSVQDADRIIVMEDGKIVDIGTHDELLEKSEIYKEIYISQQKGGEDDE